MVLCGLNWEVALRAAQVKVVLDHVLLIIEDILKILKFFFYYTFNILKMFKV